MEQSTCERYVVSKSKVKRNLLVVVIDYFRKRAFGANPTEKKGVPRNDLMLFE